MQTSDVLALARLRLAALAPERAEQIGQWLNRNETRLAPWAAVVIGTVRRRGGLRESDAPRLVDQLIGQLDATANVIEANWAKTFRGLLELFVKAAIALAEPEVSSPFLPRRVVLPTKPAERTRVNLQAAQIAASPDAPTQAELDILMMYTGFGGLSVEKNADKLPSSLVPDTKALQDEYFTLPELCEAAAAVIAALTNGNLEGGALEPAAGIGRWIAAFAARPDMQRLNWYAVEYSALSSRILAKLYPNVAVSNQPFEEWTTAHHNDLAGTLALVVTNPPYGKRGKNKFADPDKDYREDIAYIYFMRRGFDMLRAGGLGVALVPQGLLSGTGIVHRRHRERLLKRHHFLGAYRLPSDIYPGAEIVTDLSFWQARGGELDAVLPDDQAILDGHYFAAFPQYILGEESTSARGRYQVHGAFTGLPTFDPRPICQTCAPLKPYIKRLAPKSAPEEQLTDRLRNIVGLAKRVARYLDLAAGQNQSDKARAAELHGELVAAISDWMAYQRLMFGEYVPSADKELRKAANDIPAFSALLSIFQPDGTLNDAFLSPPQVEVSYQGLDTVTAHAEWLYEKQRRLVIADLLDFRRQQGFAEPDQAGLIRELLAQDWCEDWEDSGSVWVPSYDYFSGDLWPRIRRAHSVGSERAVRQSARLLELIGVATMQDAAPTLRDTWLPVKVMRSFLSHALEGDVPDLHWMRGLLKPRAIQYADMDKLPAKLRNALGYINHDLAHFSPEYSLETNPETGEEETRQQALDRARLAYGDDMTKRLRAWLASNPEESERVLRGYVETFRGYVTPLYRPDPLNIARWGKRIKLRGHQLAGAWRLIKNNGGLLAFDVGVGKTLTGIAVIGYLRQIGRARRPIIIVPNSIVWKWFFEILRAMPDYRVVVVGSTRYMGKGNVPRSRLDERGERLQKWQEFKLGLYDVALVTYSVFARLGLSEENLRQFLEETPTALREVGIKAADLQNELEQISDFIKGRNELSYKLERDTEKLPRIADGTERAQEAKRIDAQRKKLERMDIKISRLETIKGRLVAAANPTERNRAILQESINEWIAEVMHSRETDGIDFESLRCDLLVLDEAQNMKNLWAVGRREGGVPKYLGAIAEGSDRAFAFAVQSFLVQRETGGSGKVLLSATPAKNSPLELFTLLGFVDHYAWTKRGVLDPDYFIDRYLRLELKTILKPDGKVESRTAVVGFMALNELRDIVFRYGEFKNAQDVGLSLPDTDPVTEFLPMTPDQRREYNALRDEYQEIITSRDAAKDKYKALGLLQKMGLAALHPELLLQPAEGWSWGSAGRRQVVPTAKLTRAVELVLSRPECGHLIFVENVAVHRWLFDLLVAAGIPADQIAVLNAERAKTPLERQQIADGFNGIPAIVDPETGRVEQEGQAPRYRVVIANSVANEGIDLQITTCIVTHLDLPYEPATLQQRNGRAVRQGNTQSVVGIRYLCADKSYDAVKLSMITGKLRWMSDIFRGVDRETNNPAAQMDLSIEDMLLMLADDPEAAKRSMEQVRLRNEAEREAKAATEAWIRCADLIEVVRDIERTESNADRELVRKEALGVADYLRRVPEQIWPWHFLIDRITSGTPCHAVPIIENNQYSHRVIWEGLVLPLGDAKLVYFGRVEGGSFSWRVLGSHLWYRADPNPKAWESLGLLSPADYLREPTDDSQEWRAALVGAIDDEVRWSGMTKTGLHHAPDYWAVPVWQEFGGQILRALTYREVPVRDGDTVRMERARELALDDVLPPTNAGFAEFLRRVAAGTFNYTPMSEVAKDWWGRDFPRGVADPRARMRLNLPDGTEGDRRIDKTYQRLAVVEIQEDGWVIATLDGKIVDVGLDGPFLNLDNAKLAARWLAPVYGSDAQDFSLDSRQQSVIRWIELQSDLPTLAMVQTRYENL